jgi:peptidoglycan LD-endopeptidase LytH
MRRLRLIPLISLVASCWKLPVASAPVPDDRSLREDSTFVPESPLATAMATPMGLSDVEYLRMRHILVPVAGAMSSQIQDSFNDPRDGGRRHRAIDILAPRGTPVIAADDGRILRLSTNAAGGITVYAVDPEERIVYYYAHLDHYHAGLASGEHIQRGDTLGYVGTTGNAPKDTPHLHFQVMRMPYGGKQYWNGEPINPYPLFVGEP